MLKNTEVMGTERISKLLIRFSTPAIIAMMSSALYNVTDTIFLGWGVGTKGIAALVIAFPVQMFVMAVAQAVGIGAASLISRSLGAGQKKQAEYTAGMSITLTTLLSLVITFPGIVYMDNIITFLGATQSLLPYVRDYLSIILTGTFFYVVSLSTSFVVRAEGKPNVAMWSIMTGTLLNIGLDPLLIIGFNMGMKGAALATVISQAVSLGYLTAFFLLGKSHFKISWNGFLIRVKPLKEVVSIGTSAFVRIASMLVFFIVVNKTISYFGNDLHLAVMGVYNRMASLFTLPLFGLAQGMQPIVGFNFGARKYERVKHTLKITSGAATILCSAGFLLLFIFPGTVFSIFSNDPDLHTQGIPVLRLLIIMLPVVGFHQVSTSFFQSVGKAGASLLLTLSRQFLFAIPLLLVLPQFFKLTGVWFAIPIADFLAAVLSFILIGREVKRIDVLESEKPEDKQ
ncbi:MAG TPA: MATE family efflux transporter [Candidatus Deferrimicrobium sp.]|nr:MATE family efflux transporter [Candidatus Deferrimicrobium sp.]